MEQIRLPENFKYLSDCEPLELVRVKINSQALFAIVGARRGHNYHPLVVLSTLEPPFVINLIPNGHIDGDFDTYHVLSYGPCTVDPDHSEQCEIGEGALFTAPGVLLMTENDKFLSTKMDQRVGYLSLKTGALQSEPGGGRAAFPKWYVQRPDKPDPLLCFGYQDGARRSVS